MSRPVARSRPSRLAGRERMSDSRSSASCRLLSMFIRSMTWALISSVKNRALPRPLSLAEYMATSAFRIRVSPSSPCAGNMLIPMLQPTLTDRPWTMKLAFSASITRFAAIAASSESCRLLSRRRNSSPPILATILAPPTHSLSRFATALSTMSPNECPNESLMFLNRSRSINNSAIFCPLRRAPPMAFSRRSCKWARCGSSVRAS